MEKSKMDVIKKLREQIVRGDQMYPRYVQMSVEDAQAIEAELVRLRARQVDHISQRHMDARAVSVCG